MNSNNNNQLNTHTKILVMVILTTVALALFVLFGVGFATGKASASDNITLFNDDITTISSTFEQIEAIFLNADSLLGVAVDTFNMLFELMIMLGFLALTLWKKEVFLYVATGLIIIFISLTWWDDYLAISIILICVACYLLFEAVRLAFFKKSEISGEVEK